MALDHGNRLDDLTAQSESIRKELDQLQLNRNELHDKLHGGPLRQTTRSQRWNNGRKPLMIASNVQRTCLCMYKQACGS